MVPWIDAALAVPALAVALVMRPWRALGEGGPPWPWLAWTAVVPLLWTADRFVAATVVQPLSGVALLVLLAGWPLAMLALLPVAAAAAWLGDLDAASLLQRIVWLGIVPGTLALGFGLALRRWLPRHLFVYILGRAFIGTALATTAAGVLASKLHGVPAGLTEDDLLLGRWLAAWGDAWIAGSLTAIFVAYRPHWLATYTDRLYLPPTRS